MQLAPLDTVMVIDDIGLTSYILYGLKGEKKGIWSITVNGNWFITSKVGQILSEVFVSI